MLVILAGGLGSSAIRRTLGWAPMVFVGLISYSLYLWHWPVLALTRYFYGELSAVQVAIAVPVIFALAIASYWWVELPARSWRPRPRIQVARLFVAPTIGILLGSGVIVGSQGLNELIAGSPTFNAQLASLTSGVLPAFAFDYNCQQSSPEVGILTAPRCVVGSAHGFAAGEPDVLLWGDSHAAADVGILGAIAEANGTTFRNATFSSCPPLFGGDWGAAATRRGCATFRRRVEDALGDGRFRTVILGAGWSIYDRDPTFLPSLEATVRSITSEGIHVVILGQVPQFPAYQRQCAARALRWPVDCVALAARTDPGESDTEQFVRELASRMPNTAYLTVHDLICGDGRCSPYLDGRPLYFNVGHLSIDGSWRLGRMVVASPDGAAWATAIWAAGPPG
jgi:SGNH domain-containing protein